MYNEIIKNLFIGDMSDAIQFAKDYPDEVILCVLESRPINEPNGAYCVPILTYENPEAHVNKTNKKLALRVIHENLIKGKKVLVHCGAGIERSPLTVACYLADYHEMDLDRAYEIVKEHRPQAQDRRIWL